MDTKIFNAKNDYDDSKILSELNSYDYYNADSSDTAIFHFNLITDKLYHVVFHINDEYTIGTTLTGTLNKRNVDKYINAFFFIDKKIIFIESLHFKYTEIIIKYIKDVFDIEFENMNISKNVFIDLIKSDLIRQVIQFNIEENDEYIEEELTDKSQINTILNKENVKPENVIFTPNIENSYTELVSVKFDGTVNATIKKLSSFIIILKRLVGIIEKD